MKKFSSIFFVLVVIVAFIGCGKEENAELNNSSFSPTLIDPTEIFPSEFGMPNLPKDNPFTEEGVYLGRMLFYDPVLSIDSTVSCASCHKQEFAFGDPAPLSVGVFGLKTGRNASALFNMAYSQKFFWDARVSRLRDLVFEPIQAHNEMAMTLPLLETRLNEIPRYKRHFELAFNRAPNVMDMSLALEQFLLSLVSKDSKFNEFFPGNNPGLLTASELRGAFLFNGLVDFDENNVTKGADCFHCHGGELAQQNNPLMGGIANNGLDPYPTDLGFGEITNKEQDMGTFKAPSLLNVAVTGPYMHDGRFTTLEQVINHYSDSVHYENPSIHPQMSAHSGIQLNLSQQQKDDLLAYLLTMTDTAFLNNPEYSNPFVK